MDKKEIRKWINAYNLMDDLLARMQIVVKGGVAKSTVYKAFNTEKSTDTLDLIIREAEAVIAAHEQTVANALQALEPAA